MKTHMNNNKNIKKIFIFCLYNVITLSASIAGCCEKNDLNIILNKPREKLPLPNNIEMSALFSYINSPATNPQLDPQIINDNPEINIIPEKENCNNIQSAISAFTRVNKRKPEDNDKNNLAKKIQKTEKPAEVSKLLGDSSVNKQNKTEYIQNEAEYIELNFSSIDTDEKYDAEAFKLPDGKKTLVIIHCSECDSELTGTLSRARSNMCSHRKKLHGIERISLNKFKSITRARSK